jgi:hypothetical protein
MIAAEVGRGLVAGLAGTLAMTVASTVEMKIRRRPASSAPAEVASKTLGITPRDDEAKRRLGTLVHFAYGTAWGLARAALQAVGLRGRLAPLAHFGLVWGTELVMLPSTGVAPPPTKWGGKELAIDALHHLVYVTTVDAAYRALGGDQPAVDRRKRASSSA